MAQRDQSLGHLSRSAEVVRLDGWHVQGMLRKRHRRAAAPPRSVISCTAGTRSTWSGILPAAFACPLWTVKEAAAAVWGYGYDGVEWRLADGQPITPWTPTPVLGARLVLPARATR